MRSPSVRKPSALVIAWLIALEAPIAGDGRLQIVCCGTAIIPAFKASKSLAMNVTHHGGSQSVYPPRADWGRVQQLPAAERIIVETAHSAPVERRIVAADGTRLVVLNLSSPNVPADVKEAVVRIARAMPERLANTDRSEIVVSGPIRIETGGVYSRGNKVADLRDVVEAIPRAEVTRITRPALANRTVGIVLGLGLVATGGVLNLTQGRGGEASGSVLGVVLVVVGAIVTAVAAKRGAKDREDDVIYTTQPLD